MSIYHGRLQCIIYHNREASALVIRFSPFIDRLPTFDKQLGDLPDLPIFEYMKKYIHHGIFWTLYWLVIVYLDYFWLKDYEQELANGNQFLLKVAVGSILYIAPLAGLAAYIAGPGLDFLLDKTKNSLTKLAAIIVPYLLTVLLVIVIMRLWVFPKIFLFRNLPGQHFIDPGRFLSIMIEAAFPAAFLMAARFIDTRLTAAEREKNLIREKLSAELRLLKGQLHPHFLFNTLNNIYALARKKSDKTADVVMKLSQLLSYTLYEAGGEFIAVGKEIKFLEDYIDLQKIRYDDGLKIRYMVEADDPSQLIAPFLLLPLVENAFKHGAAENHLDSFIDINMRVRDGRLFFTIENSFEDTVQPVEQKNIGLNNIRRQLELTYKQHELKIATEDHIFKVALTANLRTDENA